MVRLRSCFQALIAPMLLAGVSGAAAAHTGDHPPTLATAWSASPWLLVPSTIAVALYSTGLLRLWQRAGPGRGVATIEAASLVGGVAALFLALVWPLDAFGEWSLAAHMGQHMLLLALAPPLLLAGRPFATLAHALPARTAAALHRACARLHARCVSALAAATGMHLVVMGIWHLPAATGAALGNEALHWAMHGSFLLAGLWFWAAMLGRIRDRDTGVGAGLVAVVVVMMQMGFVGALLTFSRRPLYAAYVERAPALGLDALSDQQLAGLVMWVPAAVPYLVGGLWLMLGWLRRLERRRSTTRSAGRHGGRGTGRDTSA
jgi:putative membrane protein